MGGKKGKTKKEKNEKKEEEPPEIVLKVDMHCEACATKVARTVKGFEGVEDVSADSKASKVVVKGKMADPIMVCERLQKKSRRKVELISPLPKSLPSQDKIEENKREPPAVITVVLNIRMHCEACAQGLRKRIRKLQGVESVETNVGNDQVIVKGVVEPGKLVIDVYKKTRKQASIVKDEEEKKDTDQEKKEGEDEKNKLQLDIKRREYWATKYYSEFAYTPLIFSDENPNACFVM